MPAKNKSCVLSLVKLNIGIKNVNIRCEYIKIVCMPAIWLRSVESQWETELGLEAHPLILYMSTRCAILYCFYKTNVAFICPIPEERIRKGTESSPVGTQDKCYPVLALALSPGSLCQSLKLTQASIQPLMVNHFSTFTLLHTQKTILFCTNTVIAALLL